MRKITISSYHYLLEISAVPIHVREEFLTSLLKRKNSINQKNIKLLLIIYEIIDKNKIHEWDPQIVCAAIGITPDTLNRHKSRLLKSLKKFYTGWNDSEKESILKIRYPESTYNDEERYFRINFDKALKMIENGLRTEAKNLLLKLEKKLLTSDIDKKYKYLTLSHIYERLIVYYSLKTDKPKVLHFYNFLHESVQIASKIKLTEEENILLKIWYYYGCYSKDHVKYHKKLNRAKSSYYLKKVLLEAKKINAYDYVLRALYAMASMENDLENHRKSEYYSQKGFDLATRIYHEPAKNTFLALLNISHIQLGKEYSRHDFEKIISYYFRLKKARPLDTWAFYLESFCAKICMLKNIAETTGFFKARINSNILAGGHVYAASILFYIEWDNYSKYFTKSFYLNSDNLLCPEGVDRLVLQNAEDTCLNTLSFNRSIKDFGFIKDVYLLQLLAIYFKEEDFEYEKAILIISKLNRILNFRTNKQQKKSFELLKLCINILANSNTDLVSEKYAYTFQKLVNEFKTTPAEMDLLLYAIISSLARRLRCKEITAIVKDLYRWLEANHPEILAPALREIEERTSKVKLIDGSKQSAA